MQRRDLIKRAGVTGLGLMSLPLMNSIAMASPVIKRPGGHWQHPLFATTNDAVQRISMIHGANYEKRPLLNASCDQDAIIECRNRGIDLVAEVNAVVRQEMRIEAEQTVLRQLRNRLLIWWAADQHMFVGDRHAQYIVDMIMVATSATANTVIVGPLGLTLMQSATGGRFRRIETNGFGFAYGAVSHVGWIDDRVAVLCDCYADLSVPVVIGHVAEAETDRTMAMIELPDGLMLATTPDFTDGWATIGDTVTQGGKFLRSYM